MAGPGPLASAMIVPAARYPGGCIVGSPASDIADKFGPGEVSQELVLVVFTSGRMPVYISQVRLETGAALRYLTDKSERRWSWLPFWAHRRVYFPVVCTGEEPGRIDAAERRDYHYDWEPAEKLAEWARAHGVSDKIRAVVTLGNMTAVKTKRMSVSRPPRSAFSGLTQNPDE